MMKTGMAYKDEEQAEREPRSAGDEAALVGVILQGEDHEHEDAASDELFKELAGFGQVVRWVSGENAGSGVGGRWDRADIVAFNSVDAVDVVGVDDASCEKTANELTEDIERHASPWQLAQDAAGEGHGWAGVVISLSIAHRGKVDLLEVSTAVTSDIDTQHQSNAEAPVDALPIAIADAIRGAVGEVLAKRDLSNTAATLWMC